MSFVFSEKLHFNSWLGKPEFENPAGKASYCLTAFRELENQWNILQRLSTNAPGVDNKASSLFRRKIQKMNCAENAQQCMKQMISVRNRRKSQKMIQKVMIQKVMTSNNRTELKEQKGFATVLEEIGLS